jgi:hypothetical protein
MQCPRPVAKLRPSGGSGAAAKKQRIGSKTIGVFDRAICFVDKKHGSEEAREIAFPRRDSPEF